MFLFKAATLLCLAILGCHMKINKPKSESDRMMKVKYFKTFKSLFLPRVAEFIYIEGDNKRACLLLEL